ncbi:uncharacterized protein EAE98_008778 [Botrytis deweyae]|uniref:MARVEL domain-containing protein n=1 Tax=Botrytis deweyae TaxID=2478750 RepID=A0ABQ7ID25_9HELO|nr:uncharacterized protein EAE98_008778 [Botrytis deweyae]KAF7920749.1 hypothetical protein EAE98_008778 [Botrytis deweyae]
MDIHRKFTDKVKTHPKYFQIFLVVLVVTFAIIILIAGVLKTPLLELHAPDDEYDLYLIYYFEGCRSIVNGKNDGCYSLANGGLPAVVSEDTPISGNTHFRNKSSIFYIVVSLNIPAGLPNLKIIFALFFLSGLAHLAHGLFGLKVHLNDLYHPKIENTMAFISFFTLLAAAIACPWILLDYKCQIQSISNDNITVKVGTSIIGLGFTAVLFSLVSREILIVGTLKNERAIQAFSDTPRNGEDTRRYSLDDGDSIQSGPDDEAERLQIPVHNIRQDHLGPISRGDPASMRMPMPPGMRRVPPLDAYIWKPRGHPPPPPPPPPLRVEYARGPPGPPPQMHAGYGRGPG